MILRIGFLYEFSQSLEIVGQEIAVGEFREVYTDGIEQHNPLIEVCGRIEAELLEKVLELLLPHFGGGIEGP